VALFLYYFLSVLFLNATTFSYPEPFLRAVRRWALAKSISELASDWLVLTQDIVFLPCFYGIRLWIWPEPLVAPRVRRALGTRMMQPQSRGSQIIDLGPAVQRLALTLG
jgi:hypothetical protein